MSNAASLASVKNRRSRPPQSPQNQQQQKQEQNMLLNTSNDPITPINLLKKHDVKIFCLEKQLLLHNERLTSETNQQEYVTKQDLELFKFEIKRFGCFV